ncbi:MAG: glycosyltransferase family 4 protein [Sedimentisphaerales bacterium]|nr:glycosyltransferase family 4 protein [Sedimentisphaerales bacterium]
MKLALFFTRGVSLESWLSTGLFDREKQLYEEHLRGGHFEKIYWLTYGSNDAEIAGELKAAGRLHPDIAVFPMARCFPGKLGCLLYSFLMPLFRRRWLKSADVFKTNQMEGSWSAVIAKWLYRKPLVVRTGYTASLFADKKNDVKSKRDYERIERFAYRHADIGIVASRADKKYICSKYNISPEKIEVLHNYVNTAVFYPTECEKYEDRVIFVGRLHPQKNLFNLIEAVSNNGLTLDIYGSGELHNELLAHAKKLNARVNFMGVIENDRMPAVLNRYRYYILPSFYEGMPKTLLEAMACGLVCIGTDVDGINEIIEDGVNGYLTRGTDAKALAETMNRAAQLPSDHIAQTAVRKIRDEFSLQIIAQQESRIITGLIK